MTILDFSSWIRNIKQNNNSFLNTSSDYTQPQLSENCTLLFQEYWNNSHLIASDILTTPTVNFCYLQDYSNLNFNNLGQVNPIGFDTFSFGNTTGSFARNKKQERQYGSLQEKYYKTALTFVGNINTDRAGNKRFSNNRSNQWCADFASTLAHEVFGEKLPAGFPDARKHSVSTMSIKTWAERKDINRYLDLPSSNIGQFIAQNVKPGDIMIISRGGGAGHTAIVTAVNSDGTFETVEGNIGGTSSNGGGKVGTKTRQPKAHQSKGATLIGFVQMGDIA